MSQLGLFLGDIARARQTLSRVNTIRIFYRKPKQMPSLTDLSTGTSVFGVTDQESQVKSSNEKA